MKELFGWRSTQVASRKRLLGVKSSPGPVISPTEEEEVTIYRVWLDTLGQDMDVRERYLNVARQSHVPLSKVYRSVNEFEVSAHVPKTLSA